MHLSMYKKQKNKNQIFFFPRLSVWEPDSDTKVKYQVNGR